SVDVSAGAVCVSASSSFAEATVDEAPPATGALTCVSAGVPPSRDCGPPMKETKLSKVKAVTDSATNRAVPRFLLYRISLLIFFYLLWGECSKKLKREMLKC